MISNVYIKYNGFSDTEINELASIQDDEKNKKFPQLNDSSSKIDAATKSFKDAKDAPVAPFFAELLRQPVGNLKALLGADSLKQLGEKWTNEVLPAALARRTGLPVCRGRQQCRLCQSEDIISAPSSGKLSQFYDTII